MWRRGDEVVVREIWKGRVWKARAAIVERDDDELIALWTPHGTPTKIPPGSGIPRDEWELEDGVFRHPVLRVTRPGEWHSVLLFWQGPEHDFRGWYVNLERPLSHSEVGFDYLDLELDIHVHPDRTWEYLDEDEFEEAQRLGVVSAGDAALVRAEAERVVRRVERWESPFCDGWESWRPDPAWGVPRLRPDWGVV